MCAYLNECAFTILTCKCEEKNKSPCRPRKDGRILFCSLDHVSRTTALDFVGLKIPQVVVTDGPSVGLSTTEYVSAL